MRKFTSATEDDQYNFAQAEGGTRTGWKVSKKGVVIINIRSYKNMDSCFENFKKNGSEDAKVVKKKHRWLTHR